MMPVQLRYLNNSNDLKFCRHHGLSALESYKCRIMMWSHIRFRQPTNRALWEMTLAHYRAGRFADTAATCRRVLAADPTNADALHLLGVSALKLGQLDEAVDALRQALRLRPADAEAYNNLGIALEGRGQVGKAESAYKAALRIDPRSVDALNNLGHLLRKTDRPWEAVEVYRVALGVRPDNPAAHGGLAAAYLGTGRQDLAIAHYRRRADLLPDSPVAHSDLLFYLLHAPDVRGQVLFDEHRRWAERHERPLAASVQPHDNDPDPDRVLRVGYVSPDFREHTMPRFVEPVLVNHDPAQVEYVCYSDVRWPDAVTERMRATAPEWRDTAGLGDEVLAAIIRQDRIDVLVDVTGHMGGGRLCTFAHHPAPVQMAYMGYPHSTGLESMSWRITDAISDPPGLTEAFHTEKLLRLDGCAWCYRPTESPDVSDLPVRSNGGRVTFGMLNRMAKVNPPAVRLWARVLAAVPGSALLVLASDGEGNAPVRRLFESEGIAPDRLRLVPTGPRPQYLALAHQVDINLDPFPYAGMTTTCDLLWMGVPTVTLAAGGSAGRAGASVLSAAGLSQLIADTHDDYVRIAAGLAADLPALAALRAGLRQQVERSPLRDERGTAAKLEAAYRLMWRAWCEGQCPGAGGR